MRWLQWSTNDLQNGLGGVEVHARSLARELINLGVHCKLSQDSKELDGPWDVIHTHGSQIPPLLKIRNVLKNRIWVHTLHGSTFERIKACNEWTWVGGYQAYLKEVEAVSLASGILTIHPNMDLVRIGQIFKKQIEICGNGWDASIDRGALSDDLLQKINSLKRCWVYLGRGWDAMKDSKSIEALLDIDSELNLVIAPGGGFKDHPRILKTGNLTSAQVKTLLGQVTGLVLGSVYEGLPLVVLEALALGVPVVSTEVGGISTLNSSLAGFFKVPNQGLGRNGKLLANKILKAEQMETSVSERANLNQKLLMSWKDVAKRSLDFVRLKLA